MQAEVQTIQVLIIGALALLGLWVTGRILAKAGLNRWWALIILVPVANLGAIWWFAFTRWPALDPAPK